MKTANLFFLLIVSSMVFFNVPFIHTQTRQASKGLISANEME